MKPLSFVSLLGAALGAMLGAAGPALAAEPANDKLLFVSNRAGNAQIHVMAANGSGERALTAGPAENTEPAWSPDGSRIAFTSYRDGNAEIYVMDADGARPTRLTTGAQADNAPAWTPQGRIIFRSMRDGWANFYAIDADGTHLLPLTATPQDKGVPMPSPDGRWLAYVGHGDKGLTNIYLLPADGGEARNLTGALSANQKLGPAWAPDSQRLLYGEYAGGAVGLRVIGVDGGQPGKLTDNNYGNTWASWSPDGQRIAFVSSREGTRMDMARGDIYVMAADGTGATNLTRHPAEDNYPAWSQDGKTLYFVSLREGNAQIYAVPAEGGAALRLTHNQGYDLMVRPQQTQARLADTGPAAPRPQTTN
jgi:TolB protein